MTNVTGFVKIHLIDYYFKMRLRLNPFNATIN